MPNRRTHKLAGGVTGCLAALAHERGWTRPEDRTAFALGALVGGAAGGVLPDVLDPPTSPNHRQTAHGLLSVGLATLMSREKYRNAVATLLDSAEAETDPLKRWLAFFAAGIAKGAGPGYWSHLALDGCTPYGLPLA